MADNNNPDVEKHILTQRQYFDEIASEFQQNVPEEIDFRHLEIVNYARLDNKSVVLDVATGKGALLRYIQIKGVLSRNIVACDISQTMLDEAALKYPEVPSENFICLPVESFLSDERYREFAPNGFDVILLNGCFGNFLDQHDVLAKASNAINHSGRICISHPLGSKFVLGLHEETPHIVPNTLPSKSQLETIASEVNCHITEYRDDAIFVAILERSD